MLPFFKRYRAPIAVVALIVAPLVVYRAHAVAARDANVVDRLVLGAVGPRERQRSGATDLVAERWYRYIDLVGARDDAIELRQRQVSLERRVTEAEALEVENAGLRALLGLRQRQPALRMLSAQVIAAVGSPMVRAIRIDVGLGDGVRRGMPVVTAAGVVGRVQRVGFNSSEVLLILDAKVSLEVMVPRSAARGRLAGRGHQDGPPLQVRRLLRTDDVELGDAVVTSGLADVYPPNIPVGTVTGVAMDEGGHERIADVTPSVQFDRLQLVLVVLDSADPTEPLATPPAALPDELRPATATTATARRP